MKLQANDLDAIVLTQLSARDILTGAMKENLALTQHALEADAQANYTVNVWVDLTVPASLAQECAQQVLREAADRLAT